MTEAIPAVEVAAKEELGVTPSYKDAGLTPRFARLVMQRQEIKASIKDLEERSEHVSDEIMLTMAQHDLKAVAVANFKATIITGSPRRTINQERLKEKLLSSGMSGQDVIAFLEDVTTVSTPAPFLRIDDTEKGKVRGQERRTGVVSIDGRKGKKTTAKAGAGKAAKGIGKGKSKGRK